MKRLPVTNPSRPRTLRSLPLALAALGAMATQTTAEIRPSLSFQGVTGLLDMPSGEMQEDGTLSITSAHFGPISRTTLTFQILPRLSGSFRYTGVRNWDDVVPSRYSTYYDRSFDVSYQLAFEGKYMPAVSVGLMNLVGAGFGAMPMCHGAGGLAGQYRFGARTNGSILFLGTIKLLAAILLGSSLLALCQSFPLSVLGVMLVVSGIELARAALAGSADADPWPLLATTCACLAFGLAPGFALGLAVALLRRPSVPRQPIAPPIASDT